MNLSHVVYKVNDLEDGVNVFRSQGFTVEYGSKFKPHNALIYFSEGPYIEILKSAPLPFYLSMLLRIIGKRKVVERLIGWEKSEEGFVDLCLETYEEGFIKEEEILKSYGKKYFITKSKRIDVRNRSLKWRLLFPFDLALPFFMTYFSVDPKPKEYIHPNGIKKIKSITFGIIPELREVLDTLCDDDGLQVVKGNGVLSVEYE